LARVVDQLTAHPHEPDNAVQEYLQGKGKVEEHAEEIVRLRRKVERLEQEIKSNPPPPRRDERIEFKPVS
jgi:polyhydroxyalkanoate synthesis regulator phasin